ncbi:DUF4837 family protein [Salinibacter altiplanensis]|uniref:DUF4837 family protein n=1 Tax=Salinibacter altiplanensis TaxID=1803181 RepID=UPI000C9FCAB9|nr:DUF4837 family protein [Salinibacter altiplanensis]
MRRSLADLCWLPVGALLAGLLLVTGCEGDYRPRAVGPEGEITVVMDSSHWTGPAGEALRTNVTPWVETLPVSERSFQLRHLELTDERTYERVQDLKNVIIAAPLSDSTNETSFLRRRLSGEAEQAIRNGQTAVVSKPNLWRRSQRIYYVAAAGPDALAETFQTQGPKIRDTFTEATLQRMDRNMYDEDRRAALEDTLLRRHDFAVNMQSDFQIAVDTTTGSEGFVWLRRLLAQTRREFFVYYVEDVSPDQITPEWIYNTRDSLTRRHLRGNVQGFVRVDYRRPLETEQRSFLDRYAYDSRGLWYMVAPLDEGGDLQPVGGGGPFVNYTFYDQATDRVYMLDGSIFAPDNDKLDLLRQMEVMARTFRTAEGDRPPDASPTAAK